ncbi:hypothetical protein HUJ04_012171 [Dendroctonus ponderosae]
MSLQVSNPDMQEEGKQQVDAREVPFQLTPRDTQDPSYSQLELPYRVICRQRLRQQAKVMREQFFKELKCMELFQNTALDGVRLHREFCPVVKTRVRRNQSWGDFKRLEQLLNGRDLPE